MRVGRRRRTPRLDITWYPNDTGHPRLGVVVARFGGTAVRRNLLRRQLREIARRRILPRLAAVDVVIKSRAAAYDAQVDTLGRDLEQWLSSL
jgi:ribonuclease P protein component